ncbi:MAG TPA: DUF167 family protein [Phenylobacterium sp.]|nr:DUF167 family protein [Phenylobacterium sp.]
MAVHDARRPYRLTVRVTPRGGRDAVEGWVVDDAGRAALKLRVAAAAADGAANAAVTALVAKALGLGKSAVQIASGQTARVKRLEISGVDADEIARIFGAPPG